MLSNTPDGLCHSCGTPLEQLYTGMFCPLDCDRPPAAADSRTFDGEITLDLELEEWFAVDDEELPTSPG